MIRRLTLTTITLSALLATTLLASGGNTSSTPAMGQQQKMGSGQKMMKKKRKHSPFLIKRGLPHLTKLLMKSWNDEALALSKAQQEKLMKVRQETIGGLKQIKPQVAQMTKSIVQGSRAGTKTTALEGQVEKLAALEAEATIIHLRCIEETKAILTPKQLAYIIQKKQMQKAQKMQAKKAN